MSSKFDHLKSPLENVIQIFPQSDGKALRQTIYNTVALLFVASLAAALVAVYFILQAFLKPLLWAALIGTCLHPFKYALTEYLRQWLHSMDYGAGTPLIVGTATVPFQLLNFIAEFTTQKVIKYIKMILFAFISLPVTYLLYHYGPLLKIITFCHSTLIFLSNTIGIFSTYWVASVIVGYLLLLIFYWTPDSSKWLKHLSIPIWIVTIVHLAAISGPLRLPLFLFLVFMMLTGAITYAKDHNTTFFSVSHLWVIWEFITRPRGRSGSLAPQIPSTDDEEGDLCPEEDLLDEEEADGSGSGDASNAGSPAQPDVMDGGERLPTASLSPSSASPASSQEKMRESGQDLLAPTVSPSRPDSIPIIDPICSTPHHREESVLETLDTVHPSPSSAPMTTTSSWTRWIGQVFVRDKSLSVGESGTTPPSPAPPPGGPWTSTGGSNLRSGRPGSSRSGGGQRPQASSTVVRHAFIFLLWAHLIVYLWSHLWLIHLLPVAMLMVGVKKLAGRLGGLESTRWFLSRGWARIEAALEVRKDALAPIPVRGLFKLMLRGDRKIRQFLDASLDTFVSICVILLVIFGAVFVALFLSFHIHSESINLVSMTSNVLNDTMQSELYSWLPERENMKQLFDSMMGNLYTFGREWISTKVDQVFDTNQFNKARIEEQALELWDKIYQRIVYKNDTNSSLDNALGGGVTPTPQLVRSSSITALPLSMTALWQTMTSFDMLDLQNVITFVKENLGILSTVLESVWLLLKSNLNLCLSLFTTIFSMVFGGGTVVLNFIVSSLIFLTTLFYLLAFSGESYLPVQFFTSLTPSAKSSRTIKSFYQAVEAAISGVFAATVKMALFYGFYTVLTHTLFGVNLVVIPAVLAALFGAIPFLGTYWAALPAVLELLLVHHEVGLAVTLFIIHLLPTYILDTAIYSEIKGAGHPYMTGLAIAGGVYCLGLEGAIMGPILLCFLLVAVNVYTTMLAPPAVVTAGDQCTYRSGDAPDGSKAKRYGRKVQFNPGLSRSASDHTSNVIGRERVESL